MKARFFVSVVSSIAILAVAGCGKKEEKSGGEPAKPAEGVQKPAEAPAAPAKVADPVAEAKKVFAERCVICHGATGQGDGSGAAALNPKPRNYADKEWQAKVKDEEIAKAIVGGGPAVGLSPLMPPQTDLKDQPEVVNELVKLIRGFGGGAAPAEGAAAPAEGAAAPAEGAAAPAEGAAAPAEGATEK